MINTEQIQAAAETAMSNEDWEKAAISWEKLRSLAPNNVAGYVRGSEALWQLGRFDEAWQLTVDAATRFQENLWVAHAHAEMASRRSDWATAEFLWSRIRKRFPADIAGYISGATALMQLGRLEDADDLIRHAASFDPNAQDLWIKRAEILMHRKDWLAAAVRWGFARERFPNHLNPYVRGAIALGNAGWHDDADIVARQAIAKFPHSLWAAHTYAELPTLKQDWDSAVNRWADVRVAFPNDPAGYTRGVAALHALARLEEAEAISLTGAALFPQNIELTELAATAEVRRHKYSDAAGRWSVMRQLRPDILEPWIGEAEALRLSGQLIDGWRLLSSAPTSFITDHRFTCVCLRFAIELGEFEEADRLWNDAIKIPNPPEILFDLSWKLYISQLGRDSVKHYLEFLLDEPLMPRVGWLPKISIGINSLLASPREFFKLLADIKEVRASSSGRLYNNMQLTIAMTDESADEKIFRDILDAYLPKPQRQILFMLFSRADRSHVALGSLQARANQFLVRYLRDFFALMKRDKYAANGEAAYSMLVLAYVFDRDLFHQMLEHIRALLNDRDVNAFDSTEHWQQARDAILDIAFKTVAKGPLVKLAQQGGKHRLKIALCISGQLRGFRLAKTNWDALGLGAHDVTTIVHTWTNVGRRFPHPAHADRMFLGDFFHAYVESTKRLDITALQVRYPTFFAFFTDDHPIESGELKDFYATEHVVIEDDRSHPFATYSNAMKMYYKIEAAHELALSIAKDFDLLIRIRPDKSIHSVRNVDWNWIAEKSAFERRIFCDVPPGTSPPGLFEIGDQFAVGAREPMDAYARAWSRTRKKANGYPFGMPPGYHGHVNVAVSTLHGGVMVDVLPEVEFGGELDPGPVPPEMLEKLLMSDISKRSRDDIDNLLLSACRSDKR